MHTKYAMHFKLQHRVKLIIHITLIYAAHCFVVQNAYHILRISAKSVQHRVIFWTNGQNGVKQRWSINEHSLKRVLIFYWVKTENRKIESDCEKSWVRKVFFLYILHSIILFSFSSTLLESKQRENGRKSIFIVCCSKRIRENELNKIQAKEDTKYLKS